MFCLHVFCCSRMSSQIRLYQYPVHLKMWNCLSLACAFITIFLVQSSLVLKIWLEETLDAFLDGTWLRVSFTLLDLCIDTLSNTKKYPLHTVIILLVHSFDKIQELLSCFLSVSMCPHLVVGVIVYAKHI